MYHTVHNRMHSHELRLRRIHGSPPHGGFAFIGVNPHTLTRLETKSLMHWCGGKILKKYGFFPYFKYSTFFAFVKKKLKSYRVEELRNLGVLKGWFNWSNWLQKGKRFLSYCFKLGGLTPDLKTILSLPVAASACPAPLSTVRVIST